MWTACFLTLKLATLTTLILLLIGVPLGWYLARSRSLWAEAIGALTALPIVLPPTVLGFYILLALGPHGPFAAMLSPLGVRSLAFSFGGILAGSVIYSLPFMVQPVRGAFRSIGNAPLEAATMLRASPLDAFFSVAVPLARGGIVTGAILAFAHTVGEFGVVLMVGGDIPGKTELLSIVIFNDVETMQWHAANLLAGAMTVFAFVVVLATTLIEKRMSGQR